MATPPTFPISKATFLSNTYTFDPLYAADTVAQSANIAGALGVLTRGTVLFGPISPNPITATTLLTTVPTGATARVILAQDIDTTAGQVTGVVYTQGKFLDTAMTFSSQGAAADVAELWDWGIYVMTVEQRSGILVPMMKLPTTGGPLPQSLSGQDAVKAMAEEVASIKMATVAAARTADAGRATAGVGRRPIRRHAAHCRRASSSRRCRPDQRPADAAATAAGCADAAAEPADEPVIAAAGAPAQTAGAATAGAGAARPTGSSTR